MYDQFFVQMFLSGDALIFALLFLLAAAVLRALVRSRAQAVRSLGREFDMWRAL